MQAAHLRRGQSMQGFLLSPCSPGWSASSWALPGSGLFLLGWWLLVGGRMPLATRMFPVTSAIYVSCSFALFFFFLLKLPWFGKWPVFANLPECMNCSLDSGPWSALASVLSQYVPHWYSWESPAPQLPPFLGCRKLWLFLHCPQDLVSLSS